MWQPDDEFLAFWTERHLCTLTTRRPDGSPHVVPVGATFDPDARLVRVITSRASRKVRNAAADPVVAVCQLDGRRWSTVEGTATVRDDAEAVAEAVRRYAERYRQPRVNPERVVIEIAVRRVMGTVRGTS
ncbi:pyridoxamine 5'-phosphate oxidase family protein [Actinokineospora soli]|uniref:Pyridoxamine 5'-phosphate oxidase family protein n=1 Tax=Actinokineospora soli TaxID=1048753 RepID=A0ABW2TMP8_9PSEU